ncbi:MAG: ABC transporter permease [Acidobacteriota bacterium]|nr:MAG: ABC transporter permease [Acidobacteriota bacterium]
MIGTWARRLGALFDRERTEREMRDELGFHIECETAANIERGMSPEAARRAAVLDFGGVERIKEECRDERRARWFEDLVQDVRFAGRVLMRNRGYSLAALLTLALGIGANTAIFSVIYGVLLKPLPYRDGNSLVVLSQEGRHEGDNDLGFSVREIEDLRARNRSLAELAEHHSMSFILYGDGDPERIQAGIVSANFFSVMGVRPMIGRDFLLADEAHGAPPVLLLSHEYWRRSHGGDKGIVGKVFSMNDRSHTVIGVLPPAPQYPNENDVYMPTSACPTRSSAAFIANRRSRMMDLFGRLNPDIGPERSAVELKSIGEALRKQYPESYPENRSYQINTTLLRDALTREARPTFLVLLGMAGLVLLLACANVANLTLAGVMRREREIALRSALGAGRGRLIRQLLTESSLIALIGGAVGLVLAFSCRALLVDFASKFSPRAAEISIDGSILLFTLAVSVLTGIGFGLLPALTAGESHTPALKENGSGGVTGSSRRNVRSGLVIAQVAMAFVLLIAAGLMVRSLINLQRVRPGFDPESVAVMRVSPNWSKYSTGDLYKNFAERLLDHLKGQPGVLSAAMATNYPLNPLGIANGPFNRTFIIEGRQPARGEEGSQGDYRVVSSGYFATLQLPLIAGRVFNNLDHNESRPVAVINQTLARRYWRNEDPLGRRISYDNGENWSEIVGIVGDARQYGLDREVEGEVYRPVAQAGGAPYLLVRTGVDPESLIRQIRAAIREVDDETAVDQVRTLVDARRESIASPRLTTILLTLFALLALAITTTGIAGVMALVVTQRTHELGIRLALGASQSRVLGMVLRQGMTLVVIGLAAGLLGALLFNRVMSSLLFDVRPTDPLTFLVVSIVLAVTAAMACYLPARKVISIDPMLALRNE